MTHQRKKIGHITVLKHVNDVSNFCFMGLCGGRCFLLRAHFARAWGTKQKCPVKRQSADATISLQFFKNFYKSFWRESARGNLFSKRFPLGLSLLTLLAIYFAFSSIATATATVIPTMGLFPAPMRPIISTHDLHPMLF